MEKSEPSFEETIKFRGYTLRIYGHDSLSVAITKDTCPILSFNFLTNLSNPKNPENRPWKRSKLVCKSKGGNLCLDLCSKRIERMIIRVPWSIIDPVMDGLTQYFTSVPQGVIKYFFISVSYSGVNKCFNNFSYEHVVAYKKGESIRNSCFTDKNKIFSWMLYLNAGEKHSLSDENSLVQEIISSCREIILLIIKEHEEIVAKDEARNNYVHSEDDEKVFLFSDNTRHTAITKSGNLLFTGWATYQDGFAGDFYQQNIDGMKDGLAEDYWELIPIIATADNKEAMEVLDSAIKNHQDYLLDSLIKIKDYLEKPKVSVNN